MILTRRMKHGEDTRYNELEINSVSMSGTLFAISLTCGFNDKGLQPYFDKEEKAQEFRKDLIALLRKHGWRPPGVDPKRDPA